MLNKNIPTLKEVMEKVDEKENINITLKDKEDLLNILQDNNKQLMVMRDMLSTLYDMYLRLEKEVKELKLNNENKK